MCKLSQLEFEKFFKTKPHTFIPLTRWTDQKPRKTYVCVYVAKLFSRYKQQKHLGNYHWQVPTPTRSNSKMVLCLAGHLFLSVLRVLVKLCVGR